MNYANNKTLQSLKIQNEKDFIFDAQIEYFSISCSNWILEFTSPITEKLSFMEGDVFECLTQLRIELAKYGCKPLCAGARLDVYPSGMARDMGDGLSAQVINSGSTNDWKDIQHVSIFDYAEPDLIASVEEQFNYYGSRFSVSYEFKIQHHSGSIISGLIHESRVLEPNKMKFTSPVTPDITVYDKNKFECLTNFRVELNKYGYDPLCNGARLDTYILPTDLDDDGIWLHILTLGELPNPDKRVDTFDDTEPNLIGSIVGQRKNYESWLNSIKSIPMSEYEEYDMRNLAELYFRLIKVGDLPLMWLFDIDSSTYQNISNRINQAEDDDYQERLRALSPLSPEQVEQIGSLKGEAILGFITGETLSLEYFSPNKVFKDFTQKVIASEAPKDSELQAAALEQQAGWLYIIDNRVADIEREETSPEDILGVFEIKDGQIVANSYQPNENYLIFGNNGLMQLPASLHESLIKALESLSD
jgi:hypothetical protein